MHGNKMKIRQRISVKLFIKPKTSKELILKIKVGPLRCDLDFINIGGKERQISLNMRGKCSLSWR